MALGHDAAISMHHRDGTLLARHPHVEEMIGHRIRQVRSVSELSSWVEADPADQSVDGKDG